MRRGLTTPPEGGPGCGQPESPGRTILSAHASAGAGAGGGQGGGAAFPRWHRPGARTASQAESRAGPSLWGQLALGSPKALLHATAMGPMQRFLAGPELHLKLLPLARAKDGQRDLRALRPLADQGGKLLWIDEHLILEVGQHVVRAQDAMGGTAGIDLENDQPGLARQPELCRKDRRGGRSDGAEEGHAFTFGAGRQTGTEAGLRAPRTGSAPELRSGSRFGSASTGRGAGVRGGGRRRKQGEQREEAKE